MTNCFRPVSQEAILCWSCANSKVVPAFVCMGDLGHPRQHKGSLISPSVSKSAPISSLLDDILKVKFIHCLQQLANMKTLLISDPSLIFLHICICAGVTWV